MNRREARLAAELVKKRAEELLLQSVEQISVKSRTKTQQEECKAAEDRIAKRRHRRNEVY
jgi:hypothetical protein